MGITLLYSTWFHPQTEGQTKMTTQILEDMLRAIAMEWQGSWDDHLDLIEFSYNNSYQPTIQMAPFEALYGRCCRSPVYWDDFTKAVTLGPRFITLNDRASEIDKG